MKYIDAFLNKITMYRLVLYYLIVVLATAVILSFTHTLSYNPFDIIFVSLFWVAVCWIVNTIFARVFEVTPNIESIYITALILALIVSPSLTIQNIIGMAWIAVLAMVSKYILAINKKHIFNPAAIAVLITGFTIQQSASWWVGTTWLLPVVAIGGFLIVRKIRRADMVLTALIVSAVTITIFAPFHNASPLLILQKTLLDSPLIFFATIMLTEPLTAPPSRTHQLIYGGLAGLLFVPDLHIVSLYTTPEMALVIANIYSYIVSPKMKLILPLAQKLQLTPDIVDFVFQAPPKLTFHPGQYLEWTLPVDHPDDRGNRRYFTVASSPTEQNVRIGVKFYPKGSRFKQTLSSLEPGTVVSAGQLSGTFTLPNNPNQKCVFIAGGIGVTPFRSMIKYLLDTNQKRDIILFYSNAKAADIVYTDVFNQAQTSIGLRTVYTLTQVDQIPANWQGRVGMIDQTMLIQEVPDFKERLFYLSGPHAMVVTFEKLLKDLGVPRRHIKTDYFPGFA